MKRLINHIVLFLSVLMMIYSCRHQVENATKVQQLPAIYPDYIGVTIPVDIAPLDFNFVGGETALTFNIGISSKV